MFYSFMGENPFIFEWRFKSIMGLLSGCEWSVHHIMMEEVGAPLMAGHPPWAAALSSSYIRWVELLFHSCSSLDPLVGPFSLFPLIHHTSYGLGEALLKLFLHQHHHAGVLLDCPGGSSTSAAPLERGIGGRRQAVRVTEYGSAAHL